MIVVLPVCRKDYQAALRNLSWCLDLDEKPPPFDCLLLLEFGIESTALEVAANHYFRSYSIHRYPALGKRPWPENANRAWRAAAMHLNSRYAQPWFWWEQDAVPLKSGWLSQLWEEYQRCGKPFMGTTGATDNPRQLPHLNGVAIYPKSILSNGIHPMLTSNAIPFDVAGGQRVFAQSHITPLMQHYWSPSRPFKPDSPAFSFDSLDKLNVISKDAVIFHRCKDSSLVNALSSKGIIDSYVLLGRSGDLIQLLPAFQQMYRETKRKPVVVASSGYCGVLDGVSYVKPHLVLGDWYGTVPDVREEWKKRYGVVPTVLQCHGQNWGVDTSTAPNYGVSMWQRAGFNGRDMVKSRPVFDRRDFKRERVLIDTFWPDKSKPLILYNFTGVSSPFPHEKEIRSLINEFGADFHAVNLGAIRAHRIYDLLGLIEVAQGVVTTDTATMHLMPATHTPYIGFTVGGWNTSIPRGACCLEIPYAQTLDSLEDIRDALEIFKLAPVESGFAHVYCSYPCSNIETLERQRVARLTWEKLQWVDRPVPEADMKRLWKEEGKQWQYIKDVFDYACKECYDETVIVYTNTDICVRSDLLRQLRLALRHTDAVYSFRRDFDQDFDAPKFDSEIQNGHAYCGSDLYAFRVRWWKAHRDEMPDMILGGEAWDPILRHIIDSHAVGHTTVLPNLIYHRRHASFWEQPENRYRLKMQKHCLKEAIKWFTKRGIDPQQHGIPAQLP